MIAQRVCGIILILFALAHVFYAKRIFDFFARLPSSKTMHFEEWPAWMFPAWVWLMRIIGIIGVVGGFFMVFIDR